MSEKQEDSTQTALLIIDIQDFYFEEGSSELVNPLAASLKAQKLLTVFRHRKQLVIHVKHGTGQGSGIHTHVSPLPNEKVIVKQKVNCFLETDLSDFLRANSILNLVICGMQTNMCVEAATRAAADLGYTCTLIHDACAARNQAFAGITVQAEDVHIATLATLKAYARVISSEEYLATE